MVVLTLFLNYLNKTIVINKVSVLLLCHIKGVIADAYMLLSSSFIIHYSIYCVFISYICVQLGT